MANPYPNPDPNPNPNPDPNQDIAAKEASGEMEKQKTVPVFKDMVKPGVLDGVKKTLGI